MVGGMASYEGPTVGTNWAAMEHRKRMDSLRDDRLMAAQQIQEAYKIGYNPTKGTSVSTVDEQISRKLKERRDEREVAARLALVDAFGEDIYDPGDVITFEKKFSGTKDKSYTYAAIKAPDGDTWFTTGHDCVMGTTFTWDRLIEFLVTGPYPVKSFVLKAKGGTTIPMLDKL